MSTSPSIDLSLLPAPDVVQRLDYEQILQERKARYIALFAADEQAAVARALALESEPLSIVLQENAERELILRQRVNDAARAVLLAFARGADLEHLAAEYGVSRLIVRAADDSTFPPTPAEYETDAALRKRAQMAWEGLSTAGPRDAYVFHTLSADGRVCDATAISPQPCEVLVSVLSWEGDGTASDDVLDAVRARLNDEDTRPLGDRVTVQSSVIMPYNVQALLHLKGQGPGKSVAVGRASAAISAYVSRAQRQGVSIWRTALIAALHVEGVDHVTLVEPAADLLLDATQAGTCIDIDLSVADEG